MLFRTFVHFSRVRWRKCATPCAARFFAFTAGPAECSFRFDHSRYAQLAPAAIECVSGHTSVLVTLSHTAGDDKQMAVNFSADHESTTGRFIQHRDELILRGRLVDRSLRHQAERLSAVARGCVVHCTVLSGRGIATIPPSINAASAAMRRCFGDEGFTSIAAVLLKIENGTGRLVSSVGDGDSYMIVVVNTDGNIVTVSGSFANLELDVFLKCLEKGACEGQRIARCISNQAGSKSPGNIEIPQPNENDENIRTQMLETIESVATSQLFNIANSPQSLGKTERGSALSELKALTRDCLPSTISMANDKSAAMFDALFGERTRYVYRDVVRRLGRRPDGREANAIRPLSMAVDILPDAHGCAVFKRGETQVLSQVMLDSFLRREKSQRSSRRGDLPSLSVDYTFAPFAVGTHYETKQSSRREVGHRALVFEALRNSAPTVDSLQDWPFHATANNTVLASAGSTSMASVCASSLALMDAGVPLPQHVAGVAVGCVAPTDYGETSPSAISSENYARNDSEQLDDWLTLVDISGFEDFLFDCDLKMAYCEDGTVAAIQFDQKLPGGMPLSVFKRMAHKAREACVGTILPHMTATIARPRPAARPLIFHVDLPSGVTSLFGNAGLNARRLEASLGESVHLSNVGTNYTVEVFVSNVNEAKTISTSDVSSRIRRFALDVTDEAELEFGKLYLAKVVEKTETGVSFVTSSKHNARRHFIPHRLLGRLPVAPGDELTVKFFGRDPTTGSPRFSRSVIETATSASAAARTPRPIATLDTADDAARDSLPETDGASPAEQFRLKYSNQTTKDKEHDKTPPEVSVSDAPIPDEDGAKASISSSATSVPDVKTRKRQKRKLAKPQAQEASGDGAI